MAKPTYIPVTHIEGELWADVPGYEGLYAISNFGRAKAYAKTYFCGNYPVKRTKEEHLMKQGVHRDGYMKIPVIKNGKSGQFLAHRLVAQLFILNPANKKEVNHKDGNKSNNHYSNLEWSTRSENIQHAFDTGLSRGRKGAESGMSKMILDTATGIYYDCIREAAEAKNINKYTLTNKLSEKHGHRNTTSFVYV